MEPLSEKRYLELHAPMGGDFLAARERLLAALPDGCRLTLGCLQQLYPVLSAADYRVTVTLCPGPGGTDAVRVEPGDTTAEHYGLCLDIGSTIMQMELVDLVRGRTLSQAACTNSQTQFGANILDRILAVKADRENLKTLQALTLSDVRGMIDTCCRAADIRPEAISAMTVGGNTTMLHFFLGCDPWLVFQSPYTPVFFDPGVIRAAELGLPICGNVYCMPAIANYLGGDITGGLLETDLDTREDLALFLDIGTNGELVLGCRDFLLMGAGAAGPALEGAVSHSGMRAEPGAICSVKIGADNRLRYQTIGDLPPKGICGSGILDLIAEGFLSGWIDSAGRLQKDAAPCIREVWEEDRQRNVPAIIYAYDGNVPLYFTQDDIGEFLTCKAAAHTMVATMLQSVNVSPAEIGTFYLAGGFGTHYDLESAITVGLYPDLPREKFRILGNSSLAGARRLLLDRAAAHGWRASGRLRPMCSSGKWRSSWKTCTPPASSPHRRLPLPQRKTPRVKAPLEGEPFAAAEIIFPSGTRRRVLRGKVANWGHPVSRGDAHEKTAAGDPVHGGGARGAAGAGGAGQGGADAPGVPVRLPGRDHPTGGGGEPRSLRLHSAAAGRE